MTIADPEEIETGVLAVLTGASPGDVAARMSIPAGDLCSAAEAYRAAGRTALRDRESCSGWHQIRVDFTDWQAAEQIAVTRIGPAFAQAEANGTLSRWFFTRKATSWRLRWQDTPGSAGRRGGERAEESVTGLLGVMAQRGEIMGWSPARYEMETHAFGGPYGMELAHRVFHTDSAAILRHLAPTDHQPVIRDRRAEYSILLCGLLLRSAGLDWYEQGGVWARVAAHRRSAPAHDDGSARTALRRLMTADTSSASTGPLASFTEWAAAFGNAGKALRSLSDTARLNRGLRAVLAHHVLFHWNRVGLPSDRQATLAALAREAVMNEDSAAASAHHPCTPTVRLRKHDG